MYEPRFVNQVAHFIFIFYIYFNAKITYSENPLIHRVCGHTSFQDVCVTMLNVDFHCLKATNKHEMAEAVLFRTETYVGTVVQRLISAIDKLKSLDGKRALGTCKSQFDFIYINIKSTRNVLEKRVKSTDSAMNLVVKMARANKDAVIACQDALKTFHHSFSLLSSLAMKYCDILEAIAESSIL